MCIPTHTQQRRRTLPPQMPPGWTAGCSLKSKYGSGITNHNYECFDKNIFKIILGETIATISEVLHIAILYKSNSACLFFPCISHFFNQQSLTPVWGKACSRIRMSSSCIYWASTRTGMLTDQCHSKRNVIRISCCFAIYIELHTTQNEVIIFFQSSIQLIRDIIIWYWPFS